MCDRHVRVREGLRVRAIGGRWAVGRDTQRVCVWVAVLDPGRIGRRGKRRETRWLWLGGRRLLVAVAMVVVVPQVEMRMG